MEYADPPWDAVQMTAWREQPSASAIFKAHEHASASSSTRDGLARIQAEYREMPDLRLTCEQVSRLCGIELTACEHMLEALVSAHYLERAPDGRYGLPVAQTSRRAMAAPAIMTPRHRAG